MSVEIKISAIVPGEKSGGKLIEAADKTIGFSGIKTSGDPAKPSVYRWDDNTVCRWDDNKREEVRVEAPRPEDHKDENPKYKRQLNCVVPANADGEVDPKATGADCVPRETSWFPVAPLDQKTVADCMAREGCKGVTPATYSVKVTETGSGADGFGTVSKQFDDNKSKFNDALKDWLSK